MYELLLSLLPAKNIYDATTNAITSNNPSISQAIVESLARTRALDLAVLCVLFAFHIQMKRTADGMYVLAAILIVRSIGGLYDGLDHDGLKKRVKSLSTLGFTLINSVPGFLTSALVLRGVIIVAPSPVFIVLLVLIALVPLVVHLLCDSVALRITGQGPENQVEQGATEAQLQMLPH
ncbi:hypothetical protein C8J56DRAFT_1058884 [Mycena floridula]|nr:hypothetical protein C8J56DRAFT_1058884 [Mycena floridula]